MSLGGSYPDHYRDMFISNLLLESQQMGSRLSQVCSVEMMSGNKTFFEKLGAVSAQTKSSRLEPRQYQNHTFERRQYTQALAEFSTAMDVEDLIKYSSSPKNSLITSALLELGRIKDSAIIDAIGGTTVVTTNESTSNQALTLTVAVDDHTYDSDSGDVGLTPSKLKVAQRLIKQNYGDAGGKMYVIAPNRQIMNLSVDNEIISKDFRGSGVVEGPGWMRNMSGYLGFEFIEYEETGLTGTDDKVFIVTEDAMKMGIYKPLYVHQFIDYGYFGSPEAVAIGESIGVTRSSEEKVVQIACDPLALA